MFFWVGESIIEVGELGKMVPLGLSNFAVCRALIRPLGVGVREKGDSDKIDITSS